MMHRRRSRVRWVFVSLALAVSACMPGEAGQDQVLLRPEGDLLAAGETVERSESVVGDVMLVGGTVDFLGDVGGSYLGAGGLQEVHGRIDGSGRVAGGTVRFGSSVGRNVTLAGGNVELLEEAVVERNAYLAGGTVDVEGQIRGDLYVGAREVLLDGTIDGDVRVEAERLSIGPSARIAGDLRYRVDPEQATISSEADIGGEVEALPPRESVGPSPIAMYVIRIASFVLFGGVLVALFPGTASATVEAVRRRPAPALGLGVLWAICVPLAALVIAITVVGLPLGLILAAVYAASVYVAPAVPAMWLGDLLVRPREESVRASRLRAFLVGGPLIGIAILLPWAGVIVRLAAGLLGLGAMALMIGDRWTARAPG
jgi:cytoskeletal protein CcmA (bactofilin family)